MFPGPLQHGGDVHLGHPSGEGSADRSGFSGGSRTAVSDGALESLTGDGDSSATSRDLLEAALRVTLRVDVNHGVIVPHAGLQVGIRWVHYGLRPRADMAYPPDGSTKGHLVIEMPVGARVLPAPPSTRNRVAIEIWAEVDADAPRENRGFRVVGTGQSIPGDCGEFVGTVVTHGGEFVWHVFEAAT